MPEATSIPFKKEDAKYVDLNISPEILTIYYLSHITKIDLLSMVLLFEKLGSGLYYLFYMLSKRKISFPSEANLLKAIKFSDTVEILDSGVANTSKISDRDQEIYKDLLKSLVDRRYIRMKIETSDDTTILHLPKTSTTNTKSVLNSSIKKYIRKEKRRLDKLGQINDLFVTSSEVRNTLIDKIYSLFKDKITEDDKVEDLKQLIGLLIDGYNN